VERKEQSKAHRRRSEEGAEQSRAKEEHAPVGRAEVGGADERTEQVGSRMEAESWCDGGKRKAGDGWRQAGG
jgi:hypothetical protein